jgi:hypothetical protein
MARPITQNRKEYQVARRKSWETQRRVVDPKLVRQLKDIEGQSKRREIKTGAELDDFTANDSYYGSMVKRWDAHTKAKEASAFAESEKKRRTKRAYAESQVRPTAKKPTKSKRFRVRSRKAGGTRRNKK